MEFSESLRSHAKHVCILDTSDRLSTEPLVGICGCPSRSLYSLCHQVTTRLESVDELRKIFSAFGKFVTATVRHRVDAKTGENTSWALVVMGDPCAPMRVPVVASCL